MLNNSLGILSLSIDPINYLMWSHYANCHKGFCIGFNLLKLASIIDIQYPLLINYQEEIPTWHIKEGEEEYAKKYLGTKGLLWEYEQEIRFMSKKYINKAIKFDIDIIEEIFVGYQMDENHINQICQFYSKNHPKCPIYKVHFAPNKYDLEGKRIN